MMSMYLRFILAIYGVSLVACQHTALTQMIQKQQKDLQNYQKKNSTLTVQNELLQSQMGTQFNQITHLKKKQNFLLQFIKEQEQHMQNLKQEYQALETQRHATDRRAPVLTSVTRKLLTRFATEIGAVSQKTSYGVVMHFGRVKTHVVFTKKNKVLMTQTRFKGFTPDLYFINDWNRTRRFSRAYLEKEGVIILESEVDLEPGMSQKALKNWLKSYGLLVNFFQVSMYKNEHNKGEGQKNRSRKSSKKKSKKSSKKLPAFDRSKAQEI